ncbi:DNA polymerase [Thalassiosira pseudonana CCMP1335]|uniref:DNA polymerase epsilon catalytic subunit n=1 Tax=Thalassiosira pseudonana TaxID=35128 RepID=B8BW81_THAPS|nr:DNA polymerase [Thalassiosira pseudonana CCMP1335]EED94471.1 DNA polymerase [Thalassiosira pseudonana CCMP1335]
MLSTLLRLYQPKGLNRVELLRKMDLDAPNHLGIRSQQLGGRPIIKLIFDNVDQLQRVKKEVMDVLKKNEARRKDQGDEFQFSGSFATYDATYSHDNNNNDDTAAITAQKGDPLASLLDIREHDVPYLVRVCIDLSLRAGCWYTLTPLQSGGVSLSDPNNLQKANPTVLAFDIECTKAPLKFPDANVDSIFMISYMVNGQGYLLLSRHVVGKDVANFEYTPKPKYPGPFIVMNELTEEALIRRFLQEFQRHVPQIVVTYNGDFFDWPFLERRAAVYGLDLRKEIGFYNAAGSGGGGGGTMDNSSEYRGRTAVHLDAFCWVKRDSYLPQGSQGLKAVTKYKLGYDPVEVDPEDMVRYARDRPSHMASYSVSDAVATYYLYDKYVHMFIFSLCTIIPMGPEDVLRKGSGTLCEALLMVEACTKSIICPNKQVDPIAKFTEKGNLLESETYIGGKVECLETGVYRSDIEYKFDTKPEGFQSLIDNVDRDMTFAIEVEGGIDRRKITNYDEVRAEIVEKLELLRDRPSRMETPYVYHIDVGAMYPNIILTNRLQPSAIVDDATCASCDFNQIRNDCKRKMQWVWRGDYNPATKGEYDRTKDQLSRETGVNGEGQSFNDLDEREQAKAVSDRLKLYSKNAYKKTKVTEEITRTDTVCMRENDFYVDTVRQFRDRRYEYKKLTKVWGKKIGSATTPQQKRQAEDTALVYDSLQVAHKCILNSFYGYVMRKGARWRSMEMAGIVTKTGADLIVQARKLIEQIGRPLELDTDGIWCILPGSFPNIFTFKLDDGSTFRLEYPCIMLNADVHDNFTNHQYQTLKDPITKTYEAKSECSIFFELDGPYRCMVLPASTEEGKLLKKRYAVFNFDGSLAELKGFELKRRGELELIKTFQAQVFERFLDGSSLVDCYTSVAEIANHWIDILDTRGESLDTDELVDLISENRNMSRQLDDYGDQKGTSQTTARRLGEFLGAEIIKDKGLNCKFIISQLPHGAPVTDRAVPTAIWKAEPAVMKHYLRKWLKAPEMEGDDFDIRNVLDWDYYIERLNNTIRKIITIPAALQKVPNPVPRVPHPDWLQTTVRKMNDRYKQKYITSMFGGKKAIATDIESSQKGNAKVLDIEDFQSKSVGPGRPIVHSSRRQRKSPTSATAEGGIAEARIKLTKENLPAWLKKKKELWRNQRKERRKRAVASERDQLAPDASKKQKIALGSMEGYMRSAAEALTHHEWQVIEVRELASSDGSSSDGTFLLWVMVGNKSLQRIRIKLNRTVIVDSRVELQQGLIGALLVKRVEKHLPHNKSSGILYEVSMPEVVKTENLNQILESVYEMGTPLLLRALMHLGSVCRPSSGRDAKAGKVYDLSELSPVTREYLHSHLSYRRIFLYENLNQKKKSGLVGLFIMEGGSGDKADSQDGSILDLSRPQSSKNRSFLMNATCHFWVVKPGSGKNVQQSITKKQSLTGVDDVLKSYLQANNGPTMLMVNTSKPQPQFRKLVPSCNSFPFVPLAFPPGPAHNPSTSVLPSLNWEPTAVQLCLEAYLHMGVVSYPKRVSSARFAQVPIGNFSQDENTSMFDVLYARNLNKSRAVLWASDMPNNPDVGGFRHVETDLNNNDIWGDDDALVSPVILRPGAYRCVCVEIDVYDLSIAALTDSSLASLPGASLPTSNQTGALFDTETNIPNQVISSSNPLGDEMSTAISLPILRSLVNSWLRDAYQTNSQTADDLLHDVYRLISSPDALLNDPALHRVVHSLMKTIFLRLLGELQRLGSTIISADFHKVVIATNKSQIYDAKEYVEFVISTVLKRAGLARVSLRPNNFYTHYLFLDQNNFGGIHFEQREIEDDEENEMTQLFNSVVEEDGSSSIVPTVVCGWNIMQYLANDIAQDYFRTIIGRFSKDVFRKQLLIEHKEKSKISSISPISVTKSNDEDDENSSFLSPQEQLLNYKKKMISKHFANYLTRVVGELIDDGGGAESFPKLPGSYLHLSNPALEFVKNVLVVLNLDPDVKQEVIYLKKSLFAQIGVQEYSAVTQWKNPAAAFVLPDVYCMECHECRDVDLCVMPPDDDESTVKQWLCDGCASPYNVDQMERRLVDIVQKKCIRYQLQDLRCTKTQQVAVRSMSRTSDCSAALKLDIPRSEFLGQITILRNLADFYGLDWLLETVDGVLTGYA